MQWKDCKGVEAVLESDALLCDMVNCQVLYGFEPGMSSDEAQRRRGPSSGEWIDPLYRTDAYYYDVPGGRVSLSLAPDSGEGHWVTVGYPNGSDCEDVVLNSAVLGQLLEIKAADDEIYFTLVSADSPMGSLGLHVTGAKCESVALYGAEPWMDKVVERAAEREDAPDEGRKDGSE